MVDEVVAFGDEVTVQAAGPQTEKPLQADNSALLHLRLKLFYNVRITASVVHELARAVEKNPDEVRWLDSTLYVQTLMINTSEAPK